jgi:hypothetical protein
LIEGNNKDGLEAFVKIMGADARPEIEKVAAKSMLDSIEKATGARGGPRAMREYITDHAENLQALIGRDGIDRLRGFAKIAERISADPAKHENFISAILGHHPWMGGLMVIHGIERGSPKELIWGGGYWGADAAWPGDHVSSVLRDAEDPDTDAAGAPGRADYSRQLGDGQHHAGVESSRRDGWNGTTTGD